MPLVARKSDGKAYFAASGPDMEPPEWSGRAVPASERTRWYAILAAELYHEKRSEWARSLDAYGRELVPVRMPRANTPSDWHGRRYMEGKGPPLWPFRRISRAANLMRAAWNERRAMVYWLPLRGPLGGANALTWPEILILHATRARPIRDVIGLSPEGVATAVGRAMARHGAGSGPRRLEYPVSSEAGSPIRGLAPVPIRRGVPFRARFGGPAFPVAGNVAEFARASEARPESPRRAASGVPPLPRLEPTGRARPAAFVPLLFLNDRLPRVYRLGDRWLVAKAPWGWEVLADGTTELSLLARFEGEGWEPVARDDESIPDHVRRVLFAVASGEETAAA